jgi:uncharacterized protein YecE (DUF72 family)
MQVRVGCSGWSYRHWRDDFYPPKLPAKRWFEHYASVSDTVELNNSFYRLPTEAAVRSWREQAPPGFCFSVKASRFITHFRRLRDAKPSLDRFFERIRPLGARLGPVLYQLPPDFDRDDDRLEAFLELLPSGLTHVFEFRHANWWKEDLMALLREYGAAFCAFDMGKTSTPVVATARDFYMRFHGPENAYASGYSDAELERWAERIRDLDVETAWLYFNNDVGGHAPRDALRLREILSVRGT